MNIFRPKLNQINSVVIALLFSCFLYAQKSTTTLKSISGKITYLEAPLPDVNIKIDGTTKGTKTDAQRSYYIEAKVGDVLEYSHVSFKAVAIMIEDVTTTLNIEMTAKTNTLDEVVVKARKKVDKVSHIEAKLNTKFKTSVGTIDPRASGFDIKYIEGKDLNLAAPSLSSALRGKFAGVSASNRIVYIRGLPALWDVDGQIFEIEPTIDISQVVEIYILKQSSVRYGGRSVVVVRTIANTLGNIEE